MDPYDYHNSVGFVVNNTAKMFVKALDSELRKAIGVTFSQWKILVMLSIKDGTTQKEIANGLGLEGATLIPILDKMEKDGLVIRKVDLADRRNNRVYRTDKAESMWPSMVDCALKIREISVRDIPLDHVNITLDSLQKIYSNLESHVNVNVNVNVNATEVSTPIPAATTTSVIPPNKITKTKATAGELMK
jgi:MarR family transcriptional regulator, transcriptional regulator for hemolysin